MVAFTKQEQNVALFIVCSLLVGAGVRIYRIYFTSPVQTDVNSPGVERFKSKAAELNRGSLDTLSLLNDKKSHQGTAQKGSKDLRTQTPNAALSEKTYVDINRASIDELVTLPHIGPKIAARILEYRRINGPFKEVKQLTNVKGIGSQTLKKIEPYIRQIADK